MSGFTVYGAESILAGSGMPQSLWAKLHLGNPGNAGLNNGAVETLRASVLLTPGPQLYDAVNATVASWPGPHPANEVATFLSLWNSSSGVNCWAIASISPSLSLVLGGSSSIPAGYIRLTLPVHI